MRNRTPTQKRTPDKVFATKKEAIVVLGGALRKTKKGWRTTNFNEGDDFGVAGDRLRVLAAAELYKSVRAKGGNALIMASGGKGHYRGTDTPPISSVIKSELVRAGVFAGDIIREGISNNTREQLAESVKLLKNRKIGKVTVISNRYHLPRIKAFIETDKGLRSLYGNFRLRSAEEILLKADSQKWKRKIADAYASESMKKRIALEKMGEKQIRNGTYGRQVSAKIRTAIIGLGNIAWAYEKDPAIFRRMKFPTHASVLRKHPYFQLVAAQDRSSGARKAFSSYLKKSGMEAALYESWEEMIWKERPELLVVASATDSHYEICSLAIDLGVKNILCEKPLSYSVREAERLVAKAAKHGCSLFVNYFRAFNPSYLKFIHSLQRGSLGRVRSFEAKYSRGMFNNGTHMLDLLIRMFGDVSVVKALGDGRKAASQADPTVSAYVRFRSGVSGYLRGIPNDRSTIFELEIIGTKKEIRIVKDRGGSINIRSGLYPVYDDMYSFLRLSDNKANHCSGRDSLRSLRAADAIIKSL
ncbi:MAG: Gfo/Idh/MocA family oxidoreductase [Patescibacteria group bacterium]|nr:Gfo/Idh/MocA family oxidoreductase [Patescibacteria group bacterium]